VFTPAGFWWSRVSCDFHRNLRHSAKVTFAAPHPKVRHNQYPAPELSPQGAAASEIKARRSRIIFGSSPPEGRFYQSQSDSGNHIPQLNHLKVVFIGAFSSIFGAFRPRTRALNGKNLAAASSDSSAHAEYRCNSVTGSWRQETRLQGSINPKIKSELIRYGLGGQAHDLRNRKSLPESRKRPQADGIIAAAHEMIRQ
jgi:hypothetical protein